jgi:hydroxyacylglutathione hydrolase
LWWEAEERIRFNKESIMKNLHAVVFPISLGMVKVFLIKGARSILVDTGIPGKAQAILEGMAGHGVTPDKLDLIVLTHAHPDHIGSLAALKEYTTAKIVVHRAEADVLAGRAQPELRPNSLFGRVFTLVAKEKPLQPGIAPDILIDQEFDLNPFGIQGKILHTPGHTSGSLSIVLDHGEIVVGDLVMGGMIRPLTPHYPMFATDVTKVRHSLNMLLAAYPRIIHASHGGPFDPDTIRRRLRL